MTRAWVVALLLAAPAGAQEAYAIRLKEPLKGEVRKNDVGRNTQTATKVLSPTGQVLHEKAVGNAQHAVYTETILEREPGKKPTRLRRAYEKATAWTDGKPQTLSYQGKAVLIEKKGPQYQFQVEGGPALTGAAAKLLDREFNANDTLDLQRRVLPAGPVRLNEAWKVEMAPVAREFENSTGMQVDAARATGSGQLKQVYEKDGRRFGVLAVKLEMPILAIGGQQRIALESGARLVVDVTLDACIDGTAATGVLKASFVLDAAATVPGPDGKPSRLTLTTRGALQESRTEQPR
jgi:hypothetical protein